MSTSFRRPGLGSRAVAIGGGHGLARTLQALPHVVDHVTAVVTMADDGGSSGRLRADLGVVPPGDLRMALTALARDRDLADILGYRFPAGELAGHSLGNLVLVAVQDLEKGDLLAALDRLARLLDAAGRVLPCTTAEMTLRARAGDGEVAGQAAVSDTARLEEVWLEPPDPPVTPEVVAAIERADLIALGPGSLYTSLLPNLLVPGLGRALVTATAPVVFIANLREQAAETEGMTLSDHLHVLLDHVPGLRVDAVVVHEGAPPAGEGAPLEPDVEGVAELGVRIERADLLDGADGHDPAALAPVLRRVLEAR